MMQRNKNADDRAQSQMITHIRPASRLMPIHLGELWEYGDLLLLLIWRDLKVRYKQTIIGAVWAILQPLLMMGVLSVVIGWFSGIKTGDIPYPIFTYSALVPWNFFTNVLVQSNYTILNNSGLVTRVYFPRLILPMATAGIGLVDLAIALIILFLLIGLYGITLTWTVLLLPLFILMALLTALGFGLWLAALNVEFRDFGQIVPFMMQVWFFATPIAYPITLVPEALRGVYSLNPMVGVVEGMRWALLGKGAPSIDQMLISALIVILVLVGGVIFFRYKEVRFADVI